MQVYKGSEEISLNGFEIEYDYIVEREAEIIHAGDGSGTPETMEVDITITGIGGCLNMDDFEVQNPQSNEANKISLTEWFNLNQSNIFYSGVNFSDMLVEHCVKEVFL